MLSKHNPIQELRYLSFISFKKKVIIVIGAIIVIYFATKRLVDKRLSLDH